MPGQTLPTPEPDVMARLVTHDARTGLPDFHPLSDRLEVAIAQARRYQQRAALVIIDLNTTTEMGAALGLDAGEELTLMVAEHLKLFARRSDTLAYIGDNLFAVVMSQVRDLPQILGLAVRIMKLFDGPWQLAEQSLHLSPGVGIAYYPENGENVGELIGLAHAIGMSVVAEGVERREQLALVRELGADEIQGFFFSRPLPVEECQPFLAGCCRIADGRLT